MEVNKQDIKYRTGLSLIPEIGRVRLSQLETYFTSLEHTRKASPTELKQAGLDRNVRRAMTTGRPKIPLEEAEMEKLESYSVQVLTIHDPAYPARLRGIESDSGGSAGGNERADTTIGHPVPVNKVTGRRTNSY